MAGRARARWAGGLNGAVWVLGFGRRGIGDAVMDQWCKPGRVERGRG